MKNSIRVFGACLLILLLSIFFVNQQQFARGQGELPQLGISFAQYDAGAYAAPLSDQSVDALANAGAEWINIVVTQYQFDLNTTEIYPTGKTPTNGDLIHIINKAKSLGLKVSLKPHIDIQSNPREWRGRIGRDFNETQWSNWFASYRNFISGYADLATAQDVDQLIVGTELVSTVQRESQWRDVIALVRGRYDGTLTYSANHSGEETSIQWWDALDLIGVSGYYDLTDSTNPSVADMKAAWQPHRATLQGLHNQFGKPILFTEVGYRSSDGNNRHPWCYWCDEPVDLQEQADGYQAYFEVFFNEPWFAGLHVWGWRIEPGRSGPCSDGYSPYNKPAENILRQYYGAGQKSISTVCDPSAPIATPTATATLPPQPTDVPTYAIINAAPDTPVIDGSAEFLWQSANGYKVDNVLWGGEQPAVDFKADYRALYDANYLYLFVDVKDDQLVQDSGNEWWRDDVIEVYLDGDLSAGSSYDGVNDYQLFFRWNDPQVHVGSGSGASGLVENIQFSLLTAASGYVAEIAIPLAALGISPTDGTEFGLDVQVIDDDNGDAGDTKYAWNATTDNSWQNPSLFGTARFLGQAGPGSTPTPTATAAPPTPQDTPTSPPAATNTPPPPTPPATPTAVPPTPAPPTSVPPTAVPPTPVPATPVPASGLTQEAEAGLLSGLFEIGADGAASNGAFVHVPDGSGNRGSALDPDQKVSYAFTVTQAGQYRIKTWVRSPSGSNNSFYVAVNGQPPAGHVYHTQIGSEFTEQYVTTSSGILEVSLAAGTHTVEFFLREQGTDLDKLALEQIGGGSQPAPTPTSPPAATPTTAPTAAPTTVPPTPTSVAPSPTPTQAPPIASSCGGLVREAEDGELSGLFAVASDGSASGGSYVSVPLGNGNRGSALDPAHKVSLCFTVANAGRYQLKAATLAPDSSRNSFYVQVDGVPAAGYVHHAWISSSFIEQTVFEADLSAGTHVVDFYWREHDTRLDKVMLEPIGVTAASAHNSRSNGVIIYYPVYYPIVILE